MGYKHTSILRLLKAVLRGYKREVYNYIAYVFKIKNNGAGEVGTFKIR